MLSVLEIEPSAGELSQAMRGSQRAQRREDRSERVEKSFVEELFVTYDNAEVDHDEARSKRACGCCQTTKCVSDVNEAITT